MRPRPERRVILTGATAVFVVVDLETREVLRVVVDTDSELGPYWPAFYDTRGRTRATLADQDTAELVVRDPAQEWPPWEIGWGSVPAVEDNYPSVPDGNDTAEKDR